MLDSLDGVYREVGMGTGEGEERGGSILFPDYRKIRRQMFLREIACGPLALMKVLDALGKPLNEAEAEQLVDEAGETGIDMLRLKKLAEQHGVHALGVAVSPEKLRQLGQRAIVHLDSVGFVPVLGYAKDGVIVAYPLGPAGVLPDDLFAKSFGGEGRALLISDNPLDRARLDLAADGANEERSRGPRLRPARSILAIGRLHRKHWESSLTLTNDGSEALEIKQVNASCAASVDRKNLPPGESTQLRVNGTENGLGGFTYIVEIQTNETRGSLVRIPVRGYVEQPVAFNPPTVFMGTVLPEQKASRARCRPGRSKTPARTSATACSSPARAPQET